MARYAARTNVNAQRSQEEIRRTLLRYGATAFGVFERTCGETAVVFEFESLSIQIALPMPSRDDLEFTQTDSGRERKESAAFEAWERATRQR